MHTNWFSRLGPIGTLQFILLASITETSLCVLITFKSIVYSSDLYPYYTFFLVVQPCFHLCRHFIFADGNWATGKTPELRKGYQKWFVILCVCQTLFSLFNGCFLLLHFHPFWLLPQALLMIIKIVLLVHAKRVFSAAATTQGC